MQPFHASGLHRKIDALMDRLFGAGVASHATIIEQINYLMFLRALAQHDEEAILLNPDHVEIFKGELAKYRWDNLLTLNAEALFDTLEEAYRKLPELTTDQTVALLYRNAHIKIYDKPTLRVLLHEIEKLVKELDAAAHLGSKDIFGDMYEYLLSKLAQAGTNGQFRTPRHLIKFMVDVVDPEKGETILDPACGTAGFLVEALNHLRNKYTSERFKEDGSYPMDKLTGDERDFIFNHAFTGYDSDEDMVKFGVMNLYLHYLSRASIKRQNTLVDTVGDRTKWDVILANPPFAGKIEAVSISEDLRMGTKATEALFMRYILDHLSASGKAAVVVPEGIVSNDASAYNSLRKRMVEDNYLYAVVSLPGGVFKPYAGVKTDILFFDRAVAAKRDGILLIRVNSDGFTLTDTRQPIKENDLPLALELLTAFKTGQLPDEGENYVVLPKEKVLSGKSFDLRVSSKLNTKVHDTGTWPRAKLSDVCTITKGSSPTMKTLPGPYPLVATALQRSSSDSFQFEAAAACIPLISSTGHGHASIKRIHYQDGQFALANIMCAATPRDDRLNAKYLYYFLNQYKDDLLVPLMSGAANVSMSIKDLGEVTVPLPPYKFQEQLVAELDRFNEIIDLASKMTQAKGLSVSLNSSWARVELGSLAKIEYGYTATAQQLGDARFIRITDINELGELRSEDPKYITLSAASRKYLLAKKDLLVARTGATYGKTVIFQEDYPAVFASFLVRLRLDQDRILSEYYWVYSQLEDYWKQANSLMSGGGQPQFNGNAIKQLMIPLPSIAEQERIVAEFMHVRRLLVTQNRELIAIFETKIKNKIAEAWG